MKAVVWTRYGSPDVLQQQDLERPTPKDNEVLVKVHAASINSWDWELLDGRARINLGGRLKPPYKILGCDVAGMVEDVGRNVTCFRPGDEVFGDISRDGWGGFAEFVCARETSLSRKTCRLVLRTSSGNTSGGDARPSEPSGQRYDTIWTTGSDKRRRRWRGHVRGPDREIVRG